ncbi:hypothetical protein BT96DRAFT_996617 [Gymnopus androsaceus JB14]|uniref:Uncharacterized protein n=1 Tax=Gymnopus androsaceus JB14 TaxID=1447944 RepID=A0A6A4HG75_9AGAR|nr:hypothetical protein BT96DRAFT_996617 [Gymnopus androsaceus JB14]
MRSDCPPFFSKPDLESVERIWGNVSPPIKPAVKSNEKPASTGEPQAKEPSNDDKLPALAPCKEWTSELYDPPLSPESNFVKMIRNTFSKQLQTKRSQNCIEKPPFESVTGMVKILPPKNLVSTL